MTSAPDDKPANIMQWQILSVDHYNTAEGIGGAIFCGDRGIVGSYLVEKSCYDAKCAELTKVKEELKFSYEVDSEIIKDLVPSILNPTDGVINSWLEQQLARILRDTKKERDALAIEKRKLEEQLRAEKWACDAAKKALAAITLEKRRLDEMLIVCKRQRRENLTLDEWRDAHLLKYPFIKNT